MMTDAEALRILRRHFEGLFPRVCPNCGKRYETLREYVLTTRRIGPAISWDAESGDWETRQPVGTLALANCPCGTTMSLTTRDMALPDRLALLEWVRVETRRRGIGPSELLESLRDRLRTQVLEELPS